MTVLAAHDWPTNGDLIADVFELYFADRPDALVLDPTYGRGLWWTKHRPAKLICSDLRPQAADVAAHDFTALPHMDGVFDIVAFDPPYVCVGGRKTTTLPDMHDRYGLTDAPTTPWGVQTQIDRGLAEMARVTRPRGYILCKVQDYISSGRFFDGTYNTQHAAKRLGLETIDRLEHIAGVRPQPPGRRQVHARRNLSTLFVFRR